MVIETTFSTMNRKHLGKDGHPKDQTKSSDSPKGNKSRLIFLLSTYIKNGA